MNNVFFLVDLSVIQPYLWGIFAAMCFGGMQIFIRKFNSASNPITLNFLRTALGFLIFAFVPGAIAGSSNLEFDLLVLIFLAALVGPVLSRTFQIYALKTLLASQVVLIDMLVPIFGVILTFIFLGSTPSLDETIGAIIMMVGITLP